MAVLFLLLIPTALALEQLQRLEHDLGNRDAHGSGDLQDRHSDRGNEPQTGGAVHGGKTVIKSKESHNHITSKGNQV